MRSKQLFKKAKQFIPGGVNSPVRSFKTLGIDPIYIKEAKGSKIYDVDSKEYIDYLGSWGPLILGHAHPDVIQAIQKATEKGTSFGTNTEIEIQFAEKITQIYSSINSLRFVNSGTEATMSAIRLARAYTAKDKIIKFQGCYHGHGDSFLIQSGSGVLTLGIPGSPGVTPATAQDTLIAKYNDIQSVKNLITHSSDQIAAIIVEPVMGNCGLVLPDKDFLTQLRKITSENNMLLIFDEVITGFRLALGGAQEYYGIDADITCLGKIIGGGLPVGAFGGKKEIMDYLAPQGPVYQAGTLSANPITLTAGLTTINIIEQIPNFYKELEKKCYTLVQGLSQNLSNADFNFQINNLGSMFCLFFTKIPVKSYEQAMNSNGEIFNKYYKAMIEAGIYFAPSPFEVNFLSWAHKSQDIEKTLELHKRALKKQ